MEAQQIYQKINAIAEELYRNNTTYTRADLAYELKDLSIGKDALQLSDWVWKAYVYYKKSERIRQAFVNNEKKQYLVDEYCVYPLSEQGKTKELLAVFESALDESGHALALLDDNISKALSEQIIKGGAGIVGTLTGTKGVSDVQATAASVFQRYTDMVNAYDTAKGEVRNIIASFTCLRNYINEIYCKYALALTDIFGDSIKSVSPELFDFDTIQYLDVQGMLQNVALEYDQVMDRCGELMGSISESFSNSIKSASGVYRQSGNKKVGLMLAGIEMFNHYLDARQQTTQLHGQLLTLKNNVKHDSTLVKGDMGRLLVIHKGMNDFHIPRAEAFYRYSQQVLNGELNRLIEGLYKAPELLPLKQKREHLLEQRKNANRVISDSRFNIDYYTAHIAECEALIRSMESQYVEAKSSKPSKPFFLFNILSLGSLSKKYYREIAEWYQNCQPVIEQYEGLRVDINLDMDDLAIHKKAYDENVKKLNDINSELKQSSRKMMQAIHADGATKRKIVSQLETLIKLLRLAKEIVETKLDAKLVNTVAITDYRNEQLPAEISNNIRVFTQTLENIQSGEAFARRSLDRMGNGEKGDYSEKELQIVTQAQNVAIQNAVTLFQSWTELQTQKAGSKIAAEKYDAELRKLQEKFQADMQAIDDKSAVLREALKQIHLSQDETQLKEGLLALSDMPDVLTDAEWEAFLNGTRTIDI